MKKKVDLPAAIQKRLEGEKITVVLDADIASLTLGVLMGLDDIGADFLMDVPDEVPRTETAASAEPAITIEQMEGDILGSAPGCVHPDVHTPLTDLLSNPEKEAPKKAKRKPIDTGKVKALRKAGWSLQKIADDVGCSIQSVSNILNREKENEQKEE